MRGCSITDIRVAEHMTCALRAYIEDIAGDLLLSVGEAVEGIILCLLALLNLRAQDDPYLQ